MENKNTFNKKNMEEKVKNSPSAEEIKLYEENYTKLVEDYKYKYHTDIIYTIGELKDGEKIFNVLSEYNNNHYIWTKDVWQGLLTFNKELDNIKDSLSEGFRVSASAIQYIFYIISQPTCKGIESAIWYNDNIEVIGAIYEACKEFLKNQQEELSQINIAKERVASAHQGFYYEPENTGEIEYESVKKMQEEKCECESVCADSCENCKCNREDSGETCYETIGESCDESCDESCE
ncbi:MAG: hypothetical protein RSE41_02635 [Clostridia bacterium]